MDLKPVKDYAKAQYPRLAEYFERQGENPVAGAIALAAALALIGVLCRGCQIPITS